MIARRALRLGLMVICLTTTTEIVAADQPACGMTQIGEWPVVMVQDRPTIDGSINGTKIRIVLSTAQYQTLLFRSAAKRLGLTYHFDVRHVMWDFGGDTQVDVTRVDEFRVAQDSLRDAPMYVAGEHDLGDIGALLGTDFLNKADIEFDLEHHVVRLFRIHDCAGGSPAYWAADTGADKVSVAAANGFFLAVRINGAPLLALIDSTSAVSVLNRSEAEKLGVTPETPGVTRGGSLAAVLGPTPLDYWFGPFREFAVGNEVIKDPQIPVGELWEAKAAAIRWNATRYGIRLIVPNAQYPSVLLGVDFLVSHRVLVANSQHKIYFTPIGNPMFQGRSITGQSNDSRSPPASK